MQVGKDKWLDLAINEAEPADNPFYVPDKSLYPAYFIRPGTLPEAGQTYYWRVRARRAATGQVIRSRYSPAFGFTVRAGFPVAASSYPGIESLQPCHEACDVPPYPLAFSWTPMQGTTSYRFVLSRDPGLGQPVIDQEVKATAYKLPWRLDYQTSYFWQVTAVDPVPGDPSPVFAFTTENGPPAQVQISPPGDNAIKGLLIATILSLLTLSLALVIFSRSKRGR